MNEKHGGKQEELNGMSRRALLKGAALGALATVGGVVLNLAKPGTAEVVVRKMPQKWDETWDVVVGSGFSGLAAEGQSVSDACPAPVAQC